MAISVNPQRSPPRGFAPIAQGFVIEDEPMPGTTQFISRPEPAGPRAATKAYDALTWRGVVVEDIGIPEISRCTVYGPYTGAPRAGQTAFLAANNFLALPDVFPPEATYRQFVSNPVGSGPRAGVSAYFIWDRLYILIEDVPMIGTQNLPDSARAPARSEPPSYEVISRLATEIAVEFEVLHMGQAVRDGGRLAQRPAATCFDVAQTFVKEDEPMVNSSLLPAAAAARPLAANRAYLVTAFVPVPDVVASDPLELHIAKLLPDQARPPARAGNLAFETYCRVVVPDDIPQAKQSVLPQPRAASRPSATEFYINVNIFRTPSEVYPAPGNLFEFISRPQPQPRSINEVYWATQRVVPVPDQPMTGIQTFSAAAPAPVRAGSSAYLVYATFVEPDEVQIWRACLPVVARSPSRAGQDDYQIAARTTQLEDETHTQSLAFPSRAPAAQRSGSEAYTVSQFVRVQDEFLPLPGAALPSIARAAARPANSVLFIGTSGTLLGEAPPLEARIGISQEVPRAAQRPANVSYWVDNRTQTPEQAALPFGQVSLPARPSALRAAASAFQTFASFVEPDEPQLYARMLPIAARVNPRGSQDVYWVTNRIVLDEPFLPSRLLPELARQAPRPATSAFWVDNRTQAPEDLQGRSFTYMDVTPRALPRAGLSAYWVGLRPVDISSRAGAVKGPFILVAGWIFAPGAAAGSIYVAGAVAGFVAGAEAVGVAPPPTPAIAPALESPEQLRISVQPPGTISIGSTFSLVAVVNDPNGSIDTDFAGNVTIALGANPGNAILSGPLSVTALAGVATFSGLSLNQLGSGYTVLISGQQMTSVASTTFSVTAVAVASRLVVTTQPPTSVVAGAAFGLAVSAEDAFGTVDHTFVGSVAISLGGNGGLGSLSGTLTATAVGGVATFSGLSVSLAGSGYTITASSGALANGTSNAVAVTAGSATQLAAVGPGDVASSTAFTFQADGTDALGNIDPTFAGNVTVAIGTNPAGGTLTGTLTEAATAGVSSFTDLQINNPGNGYTLSASASGLTSTTSMAFNVLSTARRVPVPSDWTYLGRMLGPTNLTDGGNAQGPMALRKKPNGTKSLMILGHAGQDIWEMSIPGFSLTNPQRAQLIQAWGLSLYSTNRTSSDPGKTSSNGLYFDIPTQRLFITYGLNYDVGGGAGGDVPVLLFAQFDPVTGAYTGTYGPFLVDVGHSRVRSGLLAIPSWFQPFVGGRTIGIFGGLYSGSSAASWGPDLFALDMPTPSTPALTKLTTKTMLFYPNLDATGSFTRRYVRSNDIIPTDALTGLPLPPPGRIAFPTAINGRQPWTETDGVYAACWPDTKVISAPIFGWSKAIGKGWYGQPTIPNGTGGTITAACVGPAGKGDNASGFQNQILAFDPNVLKQVVQGTIPSWQPSAAQQFDAAAQFGITLNCKGLYVGFAFDSDTNRVIGCLNSIDHNAGASSPGVAFDCWQLPG